MKPISKNLKSFLYLLLLCHAVMYCLYFFNVIPYSYYSLLVVPITLLSIPLAYHVAHSYPTRDMSTEIYWSNSFLLAGVLGSSYILILGGPLISFIDGDYAKIIGLVTFLLFVFFSGVRKMLIEFYYQ